MENELFENKDKAVQLITESSLETLEKTRNSLKDKINKNKENDREFFEALEKVANAIDAAISVKIEKSR